MFKIFRYKSKNLKEDVERMDLHFNKLVLLLGNSDIEITTPINYKDVDTFPIGEWIKINRYVSAKRKKNIFGNYLNFDNIVKKGGAFNLHFHDDIIESTEVIEGKMRDEATGDIYNEGDIMHYNIGVEHKPVALEDTLIKVIFKPVNE
jgi:anti-sigma factor ChrR (cupin superfamily)